jgi:TonB family protein
MSAQVHQASILSGRQLILAVTIALHAAAISGLLAWRIAEVVINKPGGILVDVRPDKPPDVPAPKNKDPVIEKFYGRLPDLRPDIPIDEERQVVVAQVVDESGQQQGAGGGNATPEVITPPPADTALSYRATRPSDDYYPPQAIRLGQEGVAIVRVCVDAMGAQSAVPRIIGSSRSRLLDGAAVNWAREALQFTPATHAGAAVAACKDFRVNFTLH